MKKAMAILVIGLLTLSFQTITEMDSEEKKFDVCISEDEMEMYDLINDYRKSKGLPHIPLSRSLSFVAQEHCRDLSDNYKRSKKCNLHSWSKEGEWSSCCYTADHKQAECMWYKPRELTDYDSEGYEIAFAKFRSDNSIPPMEPEEAVDSWIKSKGHNSVMINKGGFKNLTWNAMGVGMHNGFASVWFGVIEDSKIPLKCD
ncbi:MAG: hypothetical protein ACI8XB_001225 [Patiriisocius sp.]|jgi:uncharacterized protein YkwD